LVNENVVKKASEFLENLHNVVLQPASLPGSGTMIVFALAGGITAVFETFAF
jgi:hypothetical protein